jgi:hypothetical protein
MGRTIQSSGKRLRPRQAALSAIGKIWIDQENRTDSAINAVALKLASKCILIGNNRRAGTTNLNEGTSQKAADQRGNERRLRVASRL